MLNIKLTFYALVASLLLGFTQAKPFPRSGGPDRYPRRTLAGVSVVDTPLVRASIQYARDNSDDNLYRHVMRSWLFGSLILQHNNTLQAIVDAEVHAVALILHDLGFDQSPNSTIVTPDHRFEVDGAIAARKFIRAHRHGRHWEERRVQLVWDAIALHTEPKFAYFKESEVEVVSKSVNLDFSGPALGISQDEYAAVEKEFPRQKNFKETVIQGVSWLCRTKPETTYGELPPTDVGVQPSPSTHLI